MPQLVKGGKHVFGWSKVRANGQVMVPPEALSEYGSNAGDQLLSVRRNGLALAFVAKRPLIIEAKNIGTL